MSSRKEVATSFLRMSASGDVRNAYERYVDASFRHHNPYFRGSAEAMAAGMEAKSTEFPHKSLELERAIEDSDLVAVHSRVRLKPGGQEMALVHIFRFAGDRIAELWDIGQPVPEEMQNE